MFEALFAGEAEVGIILEEISDALDQLDRDREIEQGINVSRRDLRRPRR